MEVGAAPVKSPLIRKNKKNVGVVTATTTQRQHDRRRAFFRVLGGAKGGVKGGAYGTVI